MVSLDSFYTTSLLTLHITPDNGIYFTHVINNITPSLNTVHTHLGGRGNSAHTSDGNRAHRETTAHHRERQLFARAHRGTPAASSRVRPPRHSEPLRGACEEMPRHTILGVGHYRATSCHSMTVKPISLNPCHPAPGMMPRRHRDVTEEVPYQKTP